VKHLVFVIFVWPGAAQASEELVALYGPLLDQCYEQADGSLDRVFCIGTLSQACISQQEDGESTLGMSQCIYSEAEFWDDLLNTEYRLTMDWAEVMDDDDLEYFPEYANRAKVLRDAQRAWITFRDAECELQFAIWGSGSMRHIAGSDCIMQLTAERTIELRAKRESFE